MTVHGGLSRYFSPTGQRVDPAVLQQVASQLKLRSAVGFDPNQPRDDRGRWIDGAGQTSIFDTPSDVGRVTRRAQSMAARMGFPPSRVQVVDEPPRAFKVGDRQFTEAGHYNPVNGRIQINARNIGKYDPVGLITAHEVMHAQFDAVWSALEDEHRAINGLPASEIKRLFRMDGTAREESKAEVMDRFPVSTLWAQTWGDAFLGKGQRERMEKEDGHSDYSSAHWQPKAINTINGTKNAINETLAEIARMEENDDVRTGDRRARGPWLDLYKGIRQLYPRFKYYVEDKGN